MIDLTIDEKRRERVLQRLKERNIIIPTFAQMKDPGLVPEKIINSLKNVGLWDVDPLNLFRITWKNQPVAHGGGFGGVNYLEFPNELTGVQARIIALVGKWSPTKWGQPLLV
jgi:cysteine synthase A